MTMSDAETTNRPQLEARANFSTDAATAAAVLTNPVVTDLASSIAAQGAHRDVRDCVYFEVDDLLNYFKAHKTLSGIQRVQAGIVNYVMDEACGQGPTDYHFVVRAANPKEFHRVDRQRLREVIDYPLARWSTTAG